MLAVEPDILLVKYHGHMANLHISQSLSLDIDEPLTNKHAINCVKR